MESHPKHLLVVEDNPAHARLLLMQLAQFGQQFTVDKVEDGEQALDYVYQRGAYAGRPRPDLILLDLKLPRLDGHEVLHQLKKDQNLMSIPVVMLTTSASEGDMVRAYQECVNSYLVKPMDWDQFTEMVRLMGQYWCDWNQAPQGP